MAVSASMEEALQNEARRAAEQALKLTAGSLVSGKRSPTPPPPSSTSPVKSTAPPPPTSTASITNGHSPTEAAAAALAAAAAAAAASSTQNPDVQATLAALQAVTGQQQQLSLQLQALGAQLMGKNPLLAAATLAAAAQIPTSTAATQQPPAAPTDFSSMFQAMAQMQFLMNPAAQAGLPPPSLMTSQVRRRRRRQNRYLRNCISTVSAFSSSLLTAAGSRCTAGCFQ